ncbi:slc43a2 [Symbiodinium pilosum]|uniref:Slc43a2 protein n=1 Tax=Symbiodinium pilosum TaxID=2952 RepID=A0A812RJX6_SYMPI|nr:slc43a2 [Symbiodinium pilosum]
MALKSLATALLAFAFGALFALVAQHGFDSGAPAARRLADFSNWRPWSRLRLADFGLWAEEELSEALDAIQSELNSRSRGALPTSRLPSDTVAASAVPTSHFKYVHKHTYATGDPKAKVFLCHFRFDSLPYLG